MYSSSTKLMRGIIPLREATAWPRIVSQAPRYKLKIVFGGSLDDVLSWPLALSSGYGQSITISRCISVKVHIQIHKVSMGPPSSQSGSNFRTTCLPLEAIQTRYTRVHAHALPEFNSTIIRDGAYGNYSSLIVQTQGLGLGCAMNLIS